MRIGIDVDGVLTNLQDYQLKYGKKYFGLDKVVNEKGYDIEDIFGCTHKEREKFWLKYIWGYCLKEPIRPDMVECINRLKAEGHEIHIITGRAHTTEQNTTGRLFRKMLLYKLKQAGLNYDSITYCSESKSALEKLKICKDLQIELMVDDKKENVEALKDICKVVCVNAIYNQDVNDEKIDKIDSGNELYEIVSKHDNVFDNKTYFTKDNFKFKYGVLRSIGAPIFKLALKPTIIDKDFIPKDGPLLLCGNHLHVWDQFPVICATNRITHWMAKKEYFEGKLAPIFKSTGAICVDRYGDASKSKAEAINYLNIDSAVGLFPEGTRNRLRKNDYDELYELVNDIYSREEFDNKLRDISLIKSQVIKLRELLSKDVISKSQFINCLFDPTSDCLIELLHDRLITNDEYEDSLLLPFKYGAVSMAQKTNATIVPFAVAGDYKIGNDNLTVRFGEPYKLGNESLEEANDNLRHKVLKLVIKNRKQ